LPNFCFDKKYARYLFFRSHILTTFDYSNKYTEGVGCIGNFFEILQILENIANLSSFGINWEFLIPFTNDWNMVIPDKNKKMTSRTAQIFKELKYFNLEEMKEFFYSFPSKEEYGWCHLIQTISEFWLCLNDKIGVYASHNGEIIIIGVDTINSLSEIINNDIYNQFMYTNFEEYLKLWGDIVYKNVPNHQIDVLKNHFK
jgi:hypothetical protein